MRRNFALAEPTFEREPPFAPLTLPRLFALARLELMNCRGDACAAPQRVFQVDRATIFLQQVAERLVREFLKVFHLVVTEKIELPPSLLVELHALARHRMTFLLPKAPSFQLLSLRRRCPAPGDEDRIDASANLDLSFRRARY